MSVKIVRIDAVKLEDGTLIRHKILGYEGRIDGTTEIKGCFTAGGELLKSTTQHAFQYRIVVDGESMRRIAPAEDFEVLEGVVEVICPRCRFSFRSRPGFANKPRGRCQCGRWICPSCSACQGPAEHPSCLKQRNRQSKKPRMDRAPKVT